MKEKIYAIDLPEGEIILSTGKIANQAAGSVVVTQGGTSVLATAAYDNVESDLDYFPLSVEYIERMYAGGNISSSRFLKREGFPTEEAIIRARQVDHTIRPLFPKGFNKPVAVILTVLAYDGITDPQGLTVLAASAALMISDIPFAGPAASAVVGIEADGSLELNPKAHDHTNGTRTGEFAISGGHGRVLNYEGWGSEVSEEQMVAIMNLAVERIELLNKAQSEFVSDIAKPKMAHAEIAHNQELVDTIMTKVGDELKTALYVDEKTDRNRKVAEIKAKLVEELITDESGLSRMDISEAVEYASKKIMRAGVMQDGKRLSGRAFDEVRALNGDVDMLPSVHGSALFNRGLTQSLSIVTLGSTRMEQTIDGMEGEWTKSFMHHYNMPGFASGEAGRYRYKPGRREIGHGAIGENAIKMMMPSPDEFPYTVRVVSEIMSSNGSTSMAATCAASMALMAAGVPLKEQVGGIGVGLVTGDAEQNDFRLLLDIEGVEDFYGDMDFKVTGTKNGVTAIQFETKLEGVRPEILAEAFQLSKKGRMQVLEAMNAAISAPRTELAENAPRVDVLYVPTDKIGEIIGPGGKNIRGLIEQANQLGAGEVDIDIADDGRVTVTAVNQEQRDFVVNKISGMTAEPEIGKIYDGVIDSVMPYGAFVDVTGNISGLIHVSELADGFVKDPNDVVKTGDKVRVKLIKVERGKQSFSIKQAKEGTSSESEE